MVDSGKSAEQLEAERKQRVTDQKRDAQLKADKKSRDEKKAKRTRNARRKEKKRKEEAEKEARLKAEAAKEALRISKARNDLWGTLRDGVLVQSRWAEGGQKDELTWIAEVLKVQVLNASIVGTVGAEVSDKSTTAQKVHDFVVWARVSGVTADGMNPHWFFPQPCPDLDTRDQNYVGVEMFPMFTPKDNALRVPEVGDFIRVELPMTNDVYNNVGWYTGYVVESTLPLVSDALKGSAALIHNSGLKTTIPTDAPEIDEKDKLIIVFAGYGHGTASMKRSWKRAGMGDTKNVRFLEHWFPKGRRMRRENNGHRHDDPMKRLKYKITDKNPDGVVVKRHKKKNYVNSPKDKAQWIEWINEGRIKAIMGFSDGGSPTWQYGVTKSGKGGPGIKFAGLIDPSVYDLGSEIGNFQRPGFDWMDKPAPAHIKMVSRWQNWGLKRTWYDRQRKILQRMEKSGFSKRVEQARDYKAMVDPFFKEHKKLILK